MTREERKLRRWKIACIVALALVLVAVYMPFYDSSHSIHRVGIQAVLICKKSYSVEGSVQDTVSVYYKQFFHIFLRKCVKIKV